MSDTAVLIPAAGRGERLGLPTPKALCDLAGAPLLIHAVERAIAAPSVAKIVVAAPVAYLDLVRELLAQVVSKKTAGSLPEVLVVAGGSHRQASVYAALEAAQDTCPIVLVHDAARALAPSELFEAVAGAVRAGYEAVIPTLPVVDTVRRLDADGALAGTVDRDQLRIVQTPQGFSYEVLWKAHYRAANKVEDVSISTDDAGLVERIGGVVHAIYGSEQAFKITRPQDLLFAAALLGSQES